MHSNWQELFSATTDFLGNNGFWLVAAHKIKKTATNAAILGEGIFTMGYSKNYIMYWGVLRLL